MKGIEIKYVEIEELVPNFYRLSKENQIKLEEILYHKNLLWTHGYVAAEYNQITKAEKLYPDIPDINKERDEKESEEIDDG